MEKSRKPKIRFKGFTDDWEQRKLKDLVDRVVRKNTNCESTLPLTISAQYGLVDQITYFNNRVASRDVTNYYLVLHGEFAYNKSTSDGYPFGAIKRLDMYEKGVLSTLYIVFVPKDKYRVNSDFLTVFFDTNRWHKGVAERAAEGARNHGLLNITADDFFDIDLLVPKEIGEQAKIGEFVQKLDSLITLHQRKLDKLINVKKSMLEKMFPKQGSTVPEVRFSGFTEDWEQRKVTELGMIYIGLVTTMTSHYTNDGILLIRNSDIKDGRFEFGDNQIFLERSFAKANESRMHQLGDVITVHTGDVGTSAVITKNEVKSIGFATIVTRPNRAIINPYYLCTFLNTEKHKKWAVAISTGDGRTNYNLGDYLELIIPVPSINEQKEIALFIEKINTLITLHQRKLEKLKNIKKSMLEKMFI